MIFSAIKGKTHETIPVTTGIITEKDFEKLFDEKKSENNYYDSEFMIGGESNETYLITDSIKNSEKNSDVSEII